MFAILVAAGLGGASVYLWIMRTQSALAQSSLVATEDEVHLEDWQKTGSFIVAFGNIDIPHGTTHLSVSTPGRIHDVLVQEGERVQRNQVLIQLDSQSQQSNLAKTEAGVKEAEVRLRQAQATLEPHRLQLEQQKRVVEAAKAALEAEQRQLDRLNTVADRTGVSDSNLEIQKQKVVTQSAMVEIETLTLRQLELKNPREPIEAAQAALDMAIADREGAKSALAQMSVKAPGDGTILRIQARPGEAVSPMALEPLIWFAEDAPRIIRCEVNHRFSRRLQDGQHVLYYSDETDTLLGTGVVRRSSEWIAEQREVVPKPFRRADQRTLECIVSLDTQPERLWIGERVRVVIQTDESPRTEVAQLPISAPDQAGR